MNSPKSTAPHTYVEIAVNVPQVSGLFHYHLPAALEGKVFPGSLVVAPFGNRQVQGVVVRMVTQPDISTTRPVEDVLDAQAVITPAQMELARWMSETILAPLAVCFQPMLPPGMGQQSDILYHLNPGADFSKLEGVALRLASLLQERGDLRGRQIDTALPRQGWKTAARALARRGWLASRPVLLPPGVRPKMVRTVRLACTPEQAHARLEAVGRQGSAAQERRQKMLQFLMKDPLPVDVSWVYAVSGGSLQDLQKLEEAGLVALGETEIWRDPLQQVETGSDEVPALTAAQQQVLAPVLVGLQDAAAGRPAPAPFLLHGITGSGKTEIYMRAAEEALRLGRQAIILVPEIALTPQTVRRFLERFPGQVGLIHSRLSAGERYDTWRRARANQLPLIVGPRSALFTPLPAPGLIILDECHDPAYQQEDTPPAYHAVEAAIAYARMTNSVLVLGSATPDVSLSYRALHDGWKVLRLPVRILAHRKAVAAKLAQAEQVPPAITGDDGGAEAPNLPPVKIIDMREELKAGNRSIFSGALREALAQVLERQQQAILFLNRRGTATYVFCRQCGYTLKCPRCDLALTYHVDQGGLVCHTCNYRRQSPKTCPECGSTQIRQFGTGTEKVESDVQALFPGIRTLRWDAETTRQKGAHDLLLQTFLNHQADVLVGTQMLAKGLDLPLVTLVGVILADVGLQLPDYHAGERTFQLLTQVAGRAGRSPLGGRVILQTFMPDHYAIRAAAGHDYGAFYRQEIEHRRKLRYPPFARLVRMEMRSENAEKAAADAQTMARQVQDWIRQGDHRGTDIIGPVPCFFSRQNTFYRWQIVLRGPNPVDVLRGRPLGEWLIEVDPGSLL
jgi:primosomal protein N' (replication factor Y)